MFVSDSLNVNREGHLTVGGCDAVELAKEFGTPLYVMDEDLIRRNCRMYRESFEKNYGGRGLPVYASKAFNCKEICRVMKEENMGLDVVSIGELYTAVQVGFPPERIHFHGNNKTLEEICYALDCGPVRFAVDNLTEMETVNAESAKRGKVTAISLRIKPGIDAHTHQFIRTGQIDSKFGFALETGEAMEAVKEAVHLPNIKLVELHCHIGSQIFEPEPFVAAAEVMLDFMAEIRRETGMTLGELNLGGGFGIKYLTSDSPLPYGDYMARVSHAVKDKCRELDLPVPYIYIEPGRSIVGEAGITLYTVGAVKEIPNIRTYVSIDGGMSDNPRYALYQASYTAAVANKASLPAESKVTIAGKCCESGDLIQENTMIQKTEPGDILAVFSTGAYNYSMASNYNRIPRPAVVFVRDGKPRLAVRRETCEDLVRNDI